SRWHSGERGRESREKIRILDDKLLLVYPVEPLGLQHQILGKAVIEDAKSRAQNGFGLATLLASKPPGKAQPGRPIRVVANIVLRLITQAVAQSHVLAEVPIVFCVEAGIKDRVRGQRLPRNDGELARASTFVSYLLHRKACGQPLLCNPECVQRTNLGFAARMVLHAGDNVAS